MNAGDEQPSERERSAFHESGHVVVAFLEGLKFVNVTIEPNPQAGTSGGVHYDNQVTERLDRLTRGSCHGLSEAEQRFVESILSSTLGGPIAEEGFKGHPNSHGALHDKRFVDRLCRKVTTATGLAQGLFDRMKCRAEKLVLEEPGRTCVAAVAEALLEQTTLAYRDVKAIIEKARTPDAQDEDHCGNHE